MKNKILFFILAIFSLILPSFSAGLMFDLEKSYLIPKVARPNSIVNYFLFLTNYQVLPVYDVDITFYPPDCMKIEQNSEVSYSYIAPQETKEIPLKVNIKDCKPDVYWIKAEISYTLNGSRKTDVLFVPITVTDYPKLELKGIEYNVLSIRPSQRFRLYVTIENIGNVRVKNLKIIANSTYCAFILGKNEVYVNKLEPNESITISFRIQTPSYLKTPVCSIPLLLIYQDWADNNYKEVKLVNLPIDFTFGKIVLERYYIKELAPGETGNLTIVLRNTGESKFKNIVVKIVNKNPQISFLDQEKYIEYFLGKEAKNITFELYVDPKIEGGIYNVPIIVLYQDESGRVYNDTFIVSIKVNAKPEIQVFLNKYDKAKQEFSLIIANTGNIKAKGVYVLLEKSNDYIILDKNVEFIGELEPDDYDTVTFRIIPLKSKINVKVKVYYKDPLNNQFTKEEEVGLTVSLERKSGISSLLILFAIIFIVGIGLLIYRLWKSKEQIPPVV